MKYVRRAGASNVSGTNETMNRCHTQWNLKHWAGYLRNMKEVAMKAFGIAVFVTSLGATASHAQTEADPVIAACKSTGLIALQQESSDITDLIIDLESVAVSSATTKVEDVPIKTVVLGESYIKRGEVTGKSDRFVCLIGDKGKVLLTFFTSK